LQLLDKLHKELTIGLPVPQDRKVKYNPVPTQLFANISDEIGRTLTDLVTGRLSSKWLSGPVGIVQVVHDQGMMSTSEGLYWLGLISLNLGFFNLLPIPMLDGGTIVLTLFEWITRKKIKPKTLEKIILPFAVALICLLIYLTVNDITRIFSGIFNW
jgi:regulator of sigma E protease